MDYIDQIEEEIECYIKDLNLTGPKGIFIVLNKTFINKYSEVNVNSICLHLANKYKGIQWPKLCVDNYSFDLVLFIGRCE